MFRATLVKIAFFALVLGELWLLPPGVRAAAVVVTLLALVGFFVYVIGVPSAQFLVPSVWRLPPPAADAIAFTFDDGPDPETTPRVLELLARHGARATFFVVGARAEKHPELVRRILDEGHALGTHSYTHSSLFHFGAPRAQRAEIERGIASVERITGRAPRLFRPPQGLRTPLLRDALRALPHLVCVTWTERGLDAIGRKAPAIVRRIAPAVRAASIVTLHDGAGLGGTLDRGPTVEALATLLDLAAKRNLRCVSLAALEGAS